MDDAAALAAHKAEGAKALVICVDDNDSVVGEMTRKDAHTGDGVLHRIAVTLVVNDKKQVLVSVRKDSGKLEHSSSGHVDVGESYLQAATRELEEELGIQGVPLTRIGHSRSDDLAYKSRHTFDVFMTHAEPQELAPMEVQRVYWADPYEVAKDMEANPENYTGAFRASLKVYLGWLENEKS